MCSICTWLDFFCWNHHGDLVNVVFFSEHRVRIHHDLFNRKKPFFYLSQFAHKASSEESLTFLRSFQKFQGRFISTW